MEFHDRFWGAVAKLSWSSASQAKEIVPQSRLLPCWKGVEQFVTDFYQAVLRRAPTAYELQDWTERLAQAQGEGQQTVAAQALGRTLFGPTGMGAEYYALNPSDTQRFVSDLYWGFLQRAPDAGGSSWWVGEVNSHGRAHGIASFADSVEFKEKVVRLCGTAAASGAGGGDGYNFAAARLDPSNRTGGGDPYSRNYNFSIPLVSLTGRAGLDLGLALTYNSLVWTKDGTGVTFDADRGTPSPGFRLGFPTVQPKFYNPQTQKYAYMLVTPSGERVELRQVGTSNVYESADSSYLQLTEGDMTLRSTDGTQLSFTAAGGEWRCHLVKDRNGNYIGAAYYGDGRIWTVTDTLGRTLTFNYDNYQNLLSITQPWRRETEGNPNPTQDEAHQWATFGYANVTLQPLFSSLAVIGEQPGTVIPALSQVGLDDGSYYKFSYNQWGQVWKVTRYAADSVSANGQPNDSHPLTSTRIDLPGSDLVGASAQADCPRFTQERMWVENGVMNQSAEVTTSYDPWSPNMTSCQVTAPDGTKEISYYGGGYPWQKGLVTIEEARSVGGQVMKTTTLAWEHDGAAAAAYPTNVRVTQTSVTDPLTQPQPLTRTMKVTYTVPADFQGESGYTGTLNLSLPKKVEVCAGSNCSAPLRTTVTDYKVPNLGEYVSRRILGLARNQSLYDGADSGANLRSRVEYLYDQPDDPQNNDTFLVQLPTASPAASQHDGTNYGQSMRWRGNANRVRRYSVDQTNGAVGSYVENRAAFNVTGTLAYAKDPREHKTSLDYADSFFLNIRRTQPSTLQTYAYSTTITNPDGFTATTSYNYDMGVVREVQTPKPNETAIETANTGGPLSRRYYDAAGRVIKSLSVDTGAYTRVVYPARMDAVQSYTLIEAGVEAYAAQVLDGAGRTRAAARSLPGSAGGYAGRLFDYDQMGRLARQSNPTETNATGSTWAATGDDAVYGWLYTQASYDWKGRPRVVTNTDGTTREWTYGGCGCAGGEVVTEAGELVKTNAPPPAPAQARRTRRSYSDVLGRVWKTEVLDWNGSVYATTTTKYDTLDRAVRVRQYAGAAPEPEPVGEGAGYRTMTLAYDGHGRLQSRHTPGQDAGADTAYTYYPDDQVASVTDGRGVKTDYEYNGRHLPKSVKFYLTGLRQGQSAEATDKVTFDYDAAGNRTSMVDGAGGTNYHYDALSRMDWEDRHFTGLAGAYRLSYEYTLAGALRKVTDRLGAAVEYGYDAAGRVKQVTGTNGNAGTYVSGVSYRAWGATGSLTYGNNDLVTAGYDGRLRLKSYSVESRPAQFAHSTAMLSDYSYDADGRVRFADDRMDDRFDRAYSYDQAGRLGEAYSGGQARDFAATGAANPLSGGPYRVSYRYDEFDDLTRRDARYWGASQSTIPVLEAGTGRNQAWGYDADGRLVGDTAVAYKYDAAGRARRVSALDGSRAAEQWADGDGLVSRREERAPASGAAQATYYLRSSVLGGEVAEELDASGGRLRTYVRLGTQAVAERAGSLVTWLHANPVTGARGHSSGDGTYEATAEPDAEGINLGVEDPSGGNGGRAYSPELQMPSVLNSTGSGTPQCTMDGLLLPDCELVRNLLASGAARQCPNNDCGPRRTIYQGRPTLAFFHAYGDGYEGYVPVTGRYIGAGIVSPEATWMTRFLDEVDPNRSYTFEYTDPETGETRTYTAYGSVVSTDLSYWTLNPVSADFTYATWRRLSLEELEPRVNQIANKLTPECLEFVNNLVNTTTGKSYDAKTHLLTDLGKIANTTPSGSVDGSGIFYRSDLHAYGMGGNQGGSLAAGNASISIEGTYSPMKSTLPANIHRDASTIFNELMHAVAAADDFKGTRAFDKMGVVPVESTGKPLPYPQGSTIGPYSNYFHTGIENACKTKQ
jgi:YD repeat-containing protein